MVPVYIKTERFILRTLTLPDVNQNYCSWFNDGDAKKYIETAAQCAELENLRTYVQEKISKQDVIFLGIFTKDLEHIGNIKFEPVDMAQSYTILGVLVGAAEWRGKGVVKEVVSAAVAYLNQQYAINTIVLGVKRSNLAAVKAYQAIGFIESLCPRFLRPDAQSIEMILSVSESSHESLSKIR